MWAILKSLLSLLHYSSVLFIFGCPVQLAGFVVVCVWVGKEFPDVRWNERRTAFIRVGHAVRTVGWLEREPTNIASV